MNAARIAHVGRHCVNLDTWEVSTNGTQVRLPEKPFRVLEALLERQGRVVTRAELRERLWPDGTVVDFDNNLNSAVATLRTTFGDSAKAQKSIKTLPRLGYRLICEIRYEEPEDALVATSAGRSRSILVASAAGSVIVLSVAVLAAFSAFETGEQADGTAVSEMGSPVKFEGPSGAAAIAAWQRGLYLQAQGSVADKALAVEAYRETLRHEPDFAPAHTKLAETFVEMSFSGGVAIREGFSEAHVLATRALSLDSSSAPALRIRSLATLHLDWDFPAAGRDLQSALRLDPLDAEAYLVAATFLSALGEKDAAVLAAKRAVDLDPASSLLKSDLGFFLIAAGRYAEAIDACDSVLQAEPNSLSALRFRLIAAENLGRLQESLDGALKIMKLRGAEPAELELLQQADSRSALVSFRKWELVQVQSREHPSPFHVAVRYAGLDQRAEALSSLERSLEQREPWLMYLHGYPQFDSLRQDPRFVRIVQQVWARSLMQGDANELVTNVKRLL